MSIAPTRTNSDLLRVGELAKAVGKTVRAIRLYEELGLLRPATRSDGGFRLYTHDAIERLQWIIKLQAIGFSLTDLQGFISTFESSTTGRQATDHVREVFGTKLDAVREQIRQLQVVERDLQESLAYLESCHVCAMESAPQECSACDQHGHQPGAAPQLFAGLSRGAQDVVPLAKLQRSVKATKK